MNAKTEARVKAHGETKRPKGRKGSTDENEKSHPQN